VSTQGTATLDFGAFPGASDASIAVTGQAGILAGSYVEAWLFPALTTDHSADEHIAETIKVFAGNIVAGTGFTIYGVNTNNLNEPIYPPVIPTSVVTSTGGTAIAVKIAQPAGTNKGSTDVPVISGNGGGGNGTRIYGKWNIGWVWI
jgi:hypothetical protein